MRLPKISCRRLLFYFLAFFIASQVHSAPNSNGITQTEQGFTITLSEESQNAINNGVPLTFICKFAIQEKFAFFTWSLLTWNKARYTHRFMVSRHALSNRYLVRLNKAQKPKIFASLTQTMAYISRTSMELFGTYSSQHASQQTGQQSNYKMRLSLSKYELPGPMRLNAFISSDWNLDTGWIAWASEA